MTTTTIERAVIEPLEALIEVESQIALYYQALIDFLPEHKETWNWLGFQQRQHAGVLRAIRQTIEHSPESFSPGTCSVEAMQQIVDGIDETLQKMQAGRIDPRYAVTFIQGIENSLVESHLDNVVQSNLEGVEAMLHQLKHETQQHSETLGEMES